MGEQRRSSRQANLLKFHLVGTKRAWPESWSSAISVTWDWLENCKESVNHKTWSSLLLTINQNPLITSLSFTSFGEVDFYLGSFESFDDIHLIFSIQVVHSYIWPCWLSSFRSTFPRYFVVTLFCS